MGFELSRFVYGDQLFLILSSGFPKIFGNFKKFAPAYSWWGNFLWKLNFLIGGVVY